MPASTLEQQVRLARAFNRFYTRRIGALEEGLLRSPFSLTEARVLFELAAGGETTDAAGLARELALDPGYLSRILHGFRRRRLVASSPAPDDRRRRRLVLTGEGQAAFATLDRRSQEEVGALLRRLSPDQRERLLDAMRTIEDLLGAPPPSVTTFLLREPRPGDLGWVVQRHGALYAAEYGWDARFEALVAGVVAEFVAHFDPRRDRAWIAEREGENVGSVFVVRQTDTVARLRLLLVEPSARGHGLGARLVDECVRFARSAGYRTLTLWTNDVLHAARRIYEAAGFRLVRREPHALFGEGLVGETWVLDFTPSGPARPVGSTRDTPALPAR